MNLSELIKNIEPLGVEGTTEHEIAALAFDSREVGAATLFFALGGTQTDGHRFIDAAVAAGAAAVVCERMPETRAPRVTYITVADSARAMGMVASEFYGHPSRQLKLVGVTGTNGKTTTATLLCDLMVGLGYRAGLVSTVECRIGGRRTGSTHTTPDAISLNRMLAEMVGAGCDYCFMEVSSHSVVQERIAGLAFAGGVFTNLTHDHLDYHGTFAGYRDAKKRFFDDLPRGAFALVNTDDRNGRVMVQNTRAAVSTFATRGAADFTARVVEMHLEGMQLEVDGAEVWVRLLGRFNASNLLAVYATARLLGMERDETLRELSRLESVSGRFEYITSRDGVTAVIDYAHTPDALQNVMDTLDEVRAGGGRLFVVVGCGGNRDAAKRPVMAHIAASGSDMAILTSDNPRLEDPAAIIAQMREGLQAGDRSLAIVDRREAIRTAVAMASAGDIILVAGKGHETYQDAGGVRTHFDDREQVRDAFKNK
jgi:UDP-N-acetylmuramoyl-L-alanyl-D-glutamate--2,6-diaminopimelate ligase